MTCSQNTFVDFKCVFCERVNRVWGNASYTPWCKTCKFSMSKIASGHLEPRLDFRIHHEPVHHEEVVKEV